MSITIEADPAFDKEALTKILECCSEQPQTFQYLFNQPCSCLLSLPANDAVVPTPCVRALRCAEVAFRLWDKGLRDLMLVLQLTSHRVINDVFQIAGVSQQTDEVSTQDVLASDDLEETILTEGELQSVENLLSCCFPTPSSTLAAAIIRYGQEAVVYLRIPFENSLVYAVFDPHPRLDHPSGPSFLISRKPIYIRPLQILASPISDNSETSTYRIQRIFSNRDTALRETLDVTSKTVYRVSKERLDLDEGALRKLASSRTSWTLIESDPLLAYGDDNNLQENATPGPAVVLIDKCDPRAENVPTSSPENEKADATEEGRFSDIDSKNKFSDDFVPDPFQHSKDNIMFHGGWLEPTTPPISPRSYRTTLQANAISSPDWSNQSPSHSSDGGDIFCPLQPTWTLLPPSPPFLQSYSSSSRSIANFTVEDNYPFSADNTFCLPAFSDPGSEKISPYAGPPTPYWSRSPLSNLQRDKEHCTDDQDFQVSSWQRQATNGHFPHATIPRNKQKQKRNDLLHSGHFTTCLFPGVSGKASHEEFSPYTSAESLNPTRTGSSPESDGIGPSRLGSLDLQWRRHSQLERDGGPSCQVHTVDHWDILKHEAISEEDWEIALLRQLQEEEEIAASVAHQISADAAWMVKLQQFVAEQKLAHGPPSSRSASLDLDRQLALQLQQEEATVTPHVDSPRPPCESLPDRSNSPGPIDFECGICHERCGNDVKIAVVDCGHSYCRECVGFLARAKIDDNRYPILCPDCLIDRSRGVKCQISLDTLQGLDLSPRELERLEELQTLSHSVVLECPKCNERININRPEYGARKFIICQGRECGYKWCKDCLKPIRCLDDRHRCKNENIERLMRKRGWKYCPGCRTPVQKESGCNHMTCSAPGCNAHFCYRCGDLIVDTTNGGDVGLTVTNHYASTNCRLFDRRYCSIQ